jgi:hypothetical protein
MQPVEGISPNKPTPRNLEQQTRGKIAVGICCTVIIVAGCAALSGKLSGIPKIVAWSVAGAGGAGLAGFAWWMHKLRHLDDLITKGKEERIGNTELIEAVKQAAKTDSYVRVKWLIWLGANPLKEGRNRLVPLHHAQSRPDLEKLLVDAGA